MHLETGIIEGAMMVTKIRQNAPRLSSLQADLPKNQVETLPPRPVEYDAEQAKILSEAVLHHMETLGEQNFVRVSNGSFDAIYL